MSGLDKALLLRDIGAAWVGSPGDRRLLHGVDLLVRGNRVERIGEGLAPDRDARVVQAANWLVLPGFVNAHHHLSQQLTRTAAVGGGLIDWLTTLYPLWSHVDDESAYHGARVGIAELMLTGVTTVSDFTYFYPRGQAGIFDAQVRASRALGCRFAPVRGGLAELEAAVGERLGGALDPFLEDGDTLLNESQRAVDRYHSPAADSMCRVALGLTEKAYGDPGLMERIAALAEHENLRLHTHLHPRPDERAHCRAVHGSDPIEFLRQTGWWGDRLWVAHGTGLQAREMAEMVHRGVALCTCPSSNARFGTPIAPAWSLDRAGGKVAIGVDGAASNDGGDFVGECRVAWQMQRVRSGAEAEQLDALSPDVILEWATAGGAAALGWPELGRLEPGGLADLAAFDLARMDFVGTDDPLAALLLCGIGHRAELVLVDGVVVVEDGRLASADEDELAASGRRAATMLRERAVTREPV